MKVAPDNGDEGDGAETSPAKPPLPPPNRAIRRRPDRAAVDPGPSVATDTKQAFFGLVPFTADS
ncbi:hypothetical protein GCM10009825_20990 [Arthrobacter humicola]|uniref:Uncharacterized protein n=1 Tax=Arthrobacter humicola TaxID=409291 RepID=A0ABN2Z3D7_9MICC